MRRVAKVFDDNGSGVRGDLKAVVRAILLDKEARGMVRSDAEYGRLKEPVQFVVALARALNANTDGVFFIAQARALGQSVFESPTVFNFYPPDYVVPGTGATGTTLDWSSLTAVAGSSSALVDKLNRLLLRGTLSQKAIDAIVTAVDAIPASDALSRARTAFYLVASSAQFQVQR